jgi:plasmid maintenance system antidote protein VapI
MAKTIYARPEKITRPPIHPGEILREDVLPALHVILRRSEPKPITPDMALRIGKLCGGGAEFWARMQLRHDLWHAERALKSKLAKIEKLAA